MMEGEAGKDVGDFEGVAEVRVEACRTRLGFVVAVAAVVAVAVVDSNHSDQEVVTQGTAVLVLHHPAITHDWGLVPSFPS